MIDELTVGSGTDEPRPKVFGIGFHKTGTTSLAVALYTLGFDVCGYFGNRDPEIARNALPTAFALADRHDAAQDTPWPVLFRELDQRYSGARFILTVRPEDPWIASVTKHFKHHRIASHEWIYGVPMAAGFEDVYLERYRRHNAEVLAYFADRPNDLLVMDLSRGDGWDQLCPFLDIPRPHVAFPSSNTAGEKRRDLPRRAFSALRSRTRKRIRLSNPTKPKEARMSQVMSADFVRSIVHLHYRRFDDVIAAVISEQLSGPTPEGRQLCQRLGTLICEQLRFELEIVERLNIPLGDWLPAEHDLTLTVERWTELRTALRAHAAQLDDRSVNAKVGGDATWQVLLDLFDQGAERHARMRLVVEHRGKQLPRRRFIEGKTTGSQRRPRSRQLTAAVAR